MSRINTKTLELDHQALLDILRTSSLVFKLSNIFFSKYGITDGQFNILMTLNEFGEKGLSQQELSEQLVVHKSHMTGLVDTLAKKGYVTRKVRADDRRYNRIALGPKGVEVLKTVEGPYLEEVQRMMGHLTVAEKKNLRSYIAKMMIYINDAFRKGPKWPLPM